MLSASIGRRKNTEPGMQSMIDAEQRETLLGN